ncbi:MAG: amidohydrolase family protein [Gemmatimonadaceae bacterium]
MSIHSHTTRALGAALLVAAAASMLAAQGARRASILIRNGTVLTVTRGTLQNTDVLVENGKIARIGQNLSAPAGVEVYDATGKYVMPGIIDPHSHMMMDGINEGSLSVTSMTRVHDVLNPTAPNIYRAVAGGVTMVNLLHGSANTIGGQSATVKLKVGRSTAEMLVPNAPPGIKFALGENVTRKNRANFPGAPPPRYPTSRMGQEEIIRDAFTRARAYKAEWDAYRAQPSGRNAPAAIAPRRDLELEPLVEILDGRRFIHAHTYRADETLMLLELAAEFGFKVRTLQHALEAYKIAPEIREAGAGMSTFADSWSYKIEAFDAIPHNVAITVRNGVVSTINSDSDERIRRLNIDAAKMMRYGGLTEDEALATITINGAWQVGLEARTGSIEVGKDADIGIWNGHPFSVYSRVERTIIDGETYFDRAQDAAARAAMATERAELERAEPNQAPAPRGGPGGRPGASIGGNR